jgi:molybdopterin-guanine dinucleotide biosynthesis adapter protein
VTHPPIIQIIGYKNSGKTTLLCRLIAELSARGYRVGTAKHDAHEFDMDREGSDTWQHYEAGADAVAITSSERSALIRRRTATLEELAAAMTEVDVVVAEGFKSAPYPKIALLRDEADREQLAGARGIFAFGSKYEPEPLLKAALSKLSELGAVPSKGGGHS